MFLYATTLEYIWFKNRPQITKERTLNFSYTTECTINTSEKTSNSYKTSKTDLPTESSFP